MAVVRRLEFRLEASDQKWQDFLGVLQAGFRLEVDGRSSVRRFMFEVLGFDRDYIEHSVSTVFVDGKPVDDIDAAVVEPGSRLALSAAMPGLVGAVMRIKSPYASFRSAISYSAGEPQADVAGSDSRGFVSIKLFNSIMADRGRSLLARGVYVDEASLGFMPPGAAAAEGGASAAGDGSGETARDDSVLLRVLAAEAGA